MPIEESWGALLELVAEGKVRHGGLSNHPAGARRARARRRAGRGPPVPVLGARPRRRAAVTPTRAEHGLGVIVWAPLASGFLTDGFSLDALAEDDFRRTHPFAELDLAETREELRARGGGSVTRGALDFVLSHPAVTGAIVGVRNEREGRELAALV